MLNFDDDRSFTNWIADKPRDWATVLAARAALRLMPVTGRDRGKKTNPEKLLFLLRSVASALVYAAEPTDDAAETCRKANALQAVHSDNSSLSDIAIRAASASYATYPASMATTSLYFAASSGVGWQPSSSDAALLSNGKSPIDLIETPLWSSDPPVGWDHTNLKHLVRYAAENVDENWHVWLTWWAGRRDGNPYNLDVEQAIVRIPDADWQRGASHVNAMIAAMSEQRPA